MQEKRLFAETEIRFAKVKLEILFTPFAALGLGAAER